MRGFGAIVLSALVAGFIAGTVQLQLAIWYDSHEEFIAAEFGLVLFVMAGVAVYGVALIAGAGRPAVARIAVAFAGVLVLSVAGLEILSVWDSGPATLAADLPTLNEILWPGLLAIVIQWWFVRRHLVKQGR